MNLWILWIIIPIIIGAIIAVFIISSTCNVEPPSNIKAERSLDNNTIVITWASVPNVDLYKVYMDKKASFTVSNSKLVATTNSNYATYNPSTTGDYYFKVSAIGRCESVAVPSSGILVNVCEPPSPPTNVVANRVLETNSILVKWNASQDRKVVGYAIFAGPKPNYNPFGGLFELGRTQDTTFTYTLTNPSGDYYIKVLSYTSEKDCYSTPSPIQGVLIAFPFHVCPLIQAPTGVRVDRTINPRNVTWNVVQNTNNYVVQAYNIYRDTNPNFTLNPNASGNSDKYVGDVIGANNNRFNFSNTNVKWLPGTKYYIKVATYVTDQGFGCISPVDKPGIEVVFQ